MTTKKKQLMHNTSVFSLIAVFAVASIVLWVYFSSHRQLAQVSQPAAPASQAQAVGMVHQTVQDLKNINIDSELDTSDIDEVLQ